MNVTQERIVSGEIRSDLVPVPAQGLFEFSGEDLQRTSVGSCVRNDRFSYTPFR